MSQPSITCPACGLTSHNPSDVTEGYCGHCHDWTGAVAGLLRRPGEIAWGFFDRQGHPISPARYSWLWRQREYRVLAQDELPDGIRVSTVWLGHSRGELFETAIFLDDTIHLDSMTRYTTEAEALATHRTLVKSLELVGRSFLDEVLEDHDA